MTDVVSKYFISIRVEDLNEFSRFVQTLHESQTFEITTGVSGKYVSFTGCLTAGDVLAATLMFPSILLAERFRENIA